MSNKLEEMLIRLYESEQFYARLFFQVNRIEDKKCRTMGVGIENGKLRLEYNPEFLNKISTKCSINVLKHEAFHFINKHIFRSQGMKDKNMLELRKENIAMDCAINQYLDQDAINEVGGITLDKFKKLVRNESLLPKMPYEYYLDALNKEQKRREEEAKNGQGSGDLDQELSQYEMDDHGQFKPLDPLDQAILEDKIQKTIEATKQSAGSLPSEIEDLIKNMKKPRVNWQRELRIFVGDKLRADKKTTRSKRNRRYGITFAGHKRDYKAKLLTVIDTSGSMSNQHIQTCLNEVYGIYNTTPNLELDIVECDAKIQHVFTYKGEDTFKVKGRGGTEFQPALDYAKNNKYDGIIFLTDGGYFSKPKNVGLPVIWGIVGGYDFDIDFGKVIKIDLSEN
jgi:predicted metal-dependent peptidase